MSLIQATFAKSKPLPKRAIIAGAFNSNDMLSSSKPTTMSSTEITQLINTAVVDGSKTFLDPLTAATGGSFVGNVTISGNINSCPASKVNFLSTASSDIQVQIDTKAPTESPVFTGTVSGISKAMVGLSSADDTADTDKPVSTAQQTALDLKANLASPTFSGTVGGISKAMVGLGSVDNTADTAKPVSTAQQTALDLKANLASPTFSGTVGGISKLMVGLGSVDNTADTAKPVSTAQQTALDLKANLASPTFSGTVSGISKAMVGLGSADNTADTDKPVSTAQQTALDLKSNLASPAFTGTATFANISISGNTVLGDNSSDSVVIHGQTTFNSTVTGLTASMVGLGSCNNTSDANKPVSTAQQTALDLKANLASPTLTGVPVAPQAAGGTNTDQLATCSYVQAEISTLVGMSIPDLNTLQEIGNAINNDPEFSATITGVLSTKAPLNSPTFSGTVAGITKSMVGLGSVDNTADTAKPVSTAQQTALDLKANLASPTFSGTVSGITKSMVGLGSVDNTSDTAKPVSTAQQTALDLKANLASPTFSGTVSGITKSMVGLGSVDNTADTAKPVSTAQQTALDLKANLASPTFSGTVSGITKSMVGLGSVDNTADTDKPVSTAQQTALNLKANAANPTFTGTVNMASITTSSITDTGNCSIFGNTILGNVSSATDTVTVNAPITINGLTTINGAAIGQTPLTGANNTALVTSEWVRLQNYATLADPALTGVPTCPTAATSTSTTQIASTSFVKTNLANYATLASPALTGTPTTSTASNADSSGRIASTAFVQNNLASYALLDGASMSNVTLAAPTLSGITQGVALELTAMHTSSRISERVSTASVSSNNINVSYGSDAIVFVSGLGSSTNFSVTLSGVNPATATYRTFTITLLIDTTTYKAYANTITVNGTSRTIKWANAETPDVSAATSSGTIMQTISVIHTSSTSVPYIVLSNVTPFG